MTALTRRSALAGIAGAAITIAGPATAATRDPHRAWLEERRRLAAALEVAQARATAAIRLLPSELQRPPRVLVRGVLFKRSLRQGTPDRWCATEQAILEHFAPLWARAGEHGVIFGPAEREQARAIAELREKQAAHEARLEACGYLAACREADPIAERIEQLDELTVETVATTLDGLRAQIDWLVEFLDADPEDELYESRITLTLRDGAARLAAAAR